MARLGFGSLCWIEKLEALYQIAVKITAHKKWAGA